MRIMVGHGGGTNVNTTECYNTADDDDGHLLVHHRCYHLSLLRVLDARVLRSTSRRRLHMESLGSARSGRGDSWRRLPASNWSPAATRAFS